MRMMEHAQIFQTTVEVLGKVFKTTWITLLEWDSMLFGYLPMLIISEMDIMDTGPQIGKKQIPILDLTKTSRILFQLLMPKESTSW
jgi:hypothetical protein